MDSAAPQDRPDPFVAVRHAFWTPGASRGLPLPAGPLAPYLRAEYLPSGQAGALSDPVDHRIARMRRSLRLGLATPPEDLVAAARCGDQRTRATVTEAWPDSLRRYGADRARRALGDELPRCADPRTAALLLDLATAGRLRPLDAVRWARLREREPFTARPARHALWRHLARHPHDRGLLPAPETAADPYERLVLAAVSGARLLDPPRIPAGGGLLVVQSMLLGAMDSPGEGASGGLGVLLGSLGDALACTDPVDGVVTLVTGGGRGPAPDR